MSAIPDATVLLQDLLSPRSTQLNSTTPALIAYHLSTLTLSPATLLSTLVQCISTSPSLWRGQGTYSNAHPWEPLNWPRAKEVYESVRNGVLYRAGEIATELGTGWRARRRFGQFLDAYYAGLDVDIVHPAIRLLLHSAALAGLQLVKQRKDKLYVGGTNLLGRAEEQALLSWEGYFADTRRGSVGEWSGHSPNHLALENSFPDYLMPTWLAAETLATISIDSLQLGPLVALLALLTNSFSITFSSGSLFDSLASDLSETPEGLHWNIPSPSHTLLVGLIDSPLFQSLGSLSRAIGRCIDAAGQHGGEDEIRAVRECIDGCERLARYIQLSWAKSRWCDLEDSQLDEETRKTALPWTALKSLLFSLTLVQSSLLVLLTPASSATATPLQLQLAAQALRNLAHTYFITIKFGTDGFGAWRGLFSGLVEVIAHDEMTVAALLADLEPVEMDVVQHSSIPRSRMTFYLNVAEQLMKTIPSPYVESTVLQYCHPYLEDPQYRDTFESAHSVLLAIFASGKECANALAPWYTRLLLHAYPDLMSASQLRLAFTTMIRCVSNSDDALAWYCLLQLTDAISAIPISTAATRPPASLEQTASLAVLADDVAGTEDQTSDREFDEENTRLDEATMLSPLELQALSLQRGHLLLTLIDQTTAVNLILLRSLLEQIWSFIRAEGNDVETGAKRAQGETGKEALVKVVFNTLGEGLDATKREEGVQFWLNRSEELL